MPERNLATWNAYMLNAVREGKPNSITLCAFLNACCSDTSALELGRQLHGFVVRCGFGKDV
ncbi:hypothetical protein RchiOBHm_Chr1g0381151 [Rosa chinensis]|uniref:Pentatricopeptide n=1 Tax=Rosa chinensis TaxID=74649 RepID=A0A2P6SP25_ROSCH|nr:hypothetical protein RchiOBHm_Chr1g0381151 [Rosa chinensis]